MPRHSAVLGLVAMRLCKREYQSNNMPGCPSLLIKNSAPMRARTWLTVRVSRLASVTISRCTGCEQSSPRSTMPGVMASCRRT
eukprot:12894552-Prorocentrum_lima.AAC.2